jgi:hypothetical protein
MEKDFELKQEISIRENPYFLHKRNQDIRSKLQIILKSMFSLIRLTFQGNYSLMYLPSPAINT